MRIAFACILLLLCATPVAAGDGTASDPAADDLVELRSGEQLRGTIIAQDDDTITLDHRILGTLTINRFDIAAITIASDAGDAPPPDADADTNSDRSGATDADDDADTDATGRTDSASRSSSGEASPLNDDESDDPPSSWASTVELAFSAREGRSRNADVRVAFRTQRDTDTSRFKYDATYYTRSDRSGRTDHRVETGVFWERPRLESDWTLFAQSRFEYDEFNAWDYRVTGSTGVGYQLWNEMATDEQGVEYQHVDLRLRGGGGFRREIGSPDEDFRPEGLISAELSWRPVSRQRVGATSTYFQTLDDANDFRVVTKAEWEMAIDQMEGLNLKLGLSHEHQAVTPPEVRKDDLYLYAALVLNF